LGHSQENDVQKWFSVLDQLPPVYRRVLFYGSKDQEYFVGFYWPQKGDEDRHHVWNFETRTDPEGAYPPTHWAELEGPQP
jgi:hypothetical protein